MKNNKLNYFVEYLALILILSYFFIHEILLVVIGITFSVFLINIGFVNSSMRVISNILVIKKENKDLKKNNKVIKDDSINIKSTEEDSKLTLVETIEETGFIPSLDNSDETNVA